MDVDCALIRPSQQADAEVDSMWKVAPVADCDVVKGGGVAQPIVLLDVFFAERFYASKKEENR